MLIEIRQYENEIGSHSWDIVTHPVASSSPSHQKNFERKRSHMPQLKGEIRGAESFVVRLLIVYAIRRAERRDWKAFQKALNS